MKNTLFFDENFAPVLLKNEEADAVGMRNAIFLHFTTTASASQKLKITVRSQLTEIALSPSTEYNFQLTGEYWASGSTTSLQITNADLESGLTYISFPEIISIDAALQEQDVDNREYYLQGKQSEIDEIKTTLLIYKNGGEYNITSLQKIVEFFFLSRNDNSSALLTLTLTVICTSITDTAEIEFQFRVNSVFDLVFKPTETVENNKYIVTLTYPVEGISSSLNNHVEIYMKMSDGNAQILQGGAIATLTATGIASASEQWNGLIDIVERITNVIVPEAAIAVVPLTESATAETQPANNEDFEEVIGAVSIVPTVLALAQIAETIITGRKTTQLTIEPSRAAEYTFSTVYVNVLTEFSLRTDFDYLGSSETVDTGYMTALHLPLDDFATISSLDVTSAYIENYDRVTEDGDTRNTEAGDTRVTEG